MEATGDDDPAPGYRQQAVLLEELSELNRTRCNKLRALHDEYYVIALIDAFIRQKQVGHWRNLFTCMLSIQPRPLFCRSI